MREIWSSGILARVPNRRIEMNHRCVQVELKLNDELSRRTRAFAAIEKEVRLDLVG
jgi:hypothetical protein